MGLRNARRRLLLRRRLQLRCNTLCPRNAAAFDEIMATAAIEIASRMSLLSYFLGSLRYNPSHPAYGSFAPMVNLDKVVPQGRKVWYHQHVKNTDLPGIQAHGPPTPGRVHTPARLLIGSLPGEE